MIQNQTVPGAADERSLAANINLYYDLDVPAGEGPHPLLIALHGYGANKRQMSREARQLVPPGFAIASLQGFHQHLREPKEKGGPLRFGFGWVTNFRPEESIALHHRMLRDLIGTLVRENVADRRKVFLLGFSQTCALNFRFAFTHTDLLRGVIGICGGIPGDWTNNPNYASTKAAVLYLHGEADEFYPLERVANFGAELRQRTGDVETRSYSGGHEIVPRMREDVRAWLLARAS
jgi:predicted esterase